MPAKDTIDCVTEALTALGLTVDRIPIANQAKQARHPAADFRITHGTAKLHYAADEKPRLTPAMLGAATAQARALPLRAGQQPLLVADYITPPMAETLRALNQQFADAAGNVYLEGPGLLVYVTGRKPADWNAHPKGGEAFTRNGLKVLFALLCDPELAKAPQRAIAATAGVALGTVPAVMKDLQRAGHLLRMKQQRRLQPTKRLLDEWAAAYANQLRPRTLRGRYKMGGFALWREWAFDPTKAQWGGEPAAALLTDYLKPGVLTLYAEQLDPGLMLTYNATKARNVDDEGVLEIRRRFWGHGVAASERPDVVPTVLIYADLLATGDGRCIETAGMVYEQYLARLFEQR